MYTLLSLKAANPSKVYEVCEKDAINVNALVALLEKNFQKPEPTPGDLIVCRGYSNYYKKEVVYSQGVIDKVCENGMLHICVEPMVPHILASGHLDTSGGYWFTCHKDEIKRSQKETSGQRSFWCWDSLGPRAQGGLYFQAKLKIWSVTSSKVY